MMPCRIEIDNKLHELHMACNLSENEYAEWLFMDIQRYIFTNRATAEFLENFCTLTKRRMSTFVKYCLKGSLDGDSLIKRAKSFLKVKGECV